MKKPRPFSILLLVVLVLFFTALNLARAYQAAQYWKALRALLLVSPAYPLVSGLVWGLVGFGLALGLWKGWPNARRSMLPVFLAYSLYAWIDRLALPGYAGRNQNWPFMALGNLLILLVAAWFLNRRIVKSFFGDTHEQLLAEQFAPESGPGSTGEPQSLQQPYGLERQDPPAP